jgi:hypothetical protein
MAWIKTLGEQLLAIAESRHVLKNANSAALIVATLPAAAVTEVCLSPSAKLQFASCVLLPLIVMLIVVPFPMPLHSLTRLIALCRPSLQNPPRQIRH